LEWLPPSLERLMPIDRERGLAFVHIPKTAGTAIEQALGLHGDWRLEDRRRGFGRIRAEDLLRCRYGTNFLQHLSSAELQALLVHEGVPDWRQWWWFTVVRHPWTRLVSAFRRKDPDLCQLYAYRCDRDLHRLDLCAFLELATWLDHPHLRSQSRYLAGSASEVEVFRYEDLAALAAALSVRLNQPISVERANPPLLDLDEAALPDRQRLLARTAEIYAEDMERFQYPLSPP
jgi:hypothetical protein